MSVGQVQATRNDALGNLDVADANARQRNQMNLINQTNQLGRYQQNAWDWNKRQKFLETAASVRALMGAGNANFNQERKYLKTLLVLMNLNSVCRFKKAGPGHRVTERPAFNKKIEIYPTNYCPFCVKAKSLLNKKKIKFSEVDVSNDEVFKRKMGRRK